MFTSILKTRVDERLMHVYANFRNTCDLTHGCSYVYFKYGLRLYAYIFILHSQNESKSNYVITSCPIIFVSKTVVCSENQFIPYNLCLNRTCFSTCEAIVS